MGLSFKSLGRCRKKPGPHLNESRPDRAEGNLYVEGCSVRPLNLPERAKNPLDGQTVEKFNLLIYWFQEFGITYPTLFMIKTLPEWCLFDDKTTVSG